MSTEVSIILIPLFNFSSEKRRIERETKKDERNYNERGSSSANTESFSSANWDRNEERVSLLKGIKTGGFIYQAHEFIGACSWSWF